MQSRIKILHLEDLSSDAELIGRELRKENLDFERLVVDTKEKFIKALKEFSPDIILSDHSLPSFNSYEALSIFHNTGMKIPFILITSNMSDEFAVDILKRGADDYILKDRLTRLPTAIHHTLEKYRLEKEKQDSLEELVRNEKRYHALVENSTEGIIIHNIDGKPKYVSASVKKILGYTLEELREMDPFSILHEEDKPFMEEVVQQVLANPGIPIKGHTGRMLNKDGTYRWVEATVTNMLHDPAIMGIVDNFRDVTENKIAEQQLIYSNRLYTFISQINQAIVHIKDEQTLFETACRIAVQYGKFEIAWIGISDVTNHKIKLTASFGASESHKQLLSNYSYDAGGPIESVLNGLSYYVVNDNSKEKSLTKSKYLLESGIYSGMTLSIRKRGHVIGAFIVYSSKINFFNAPEIALMEEVTRDISFALDILENAKLKIKVDDKLKESESNLKAIFENTFEGFILTDLKGIVKAFNNKSREITLLNVEKEITKGTNVFDYFPEFKNDIYRETILKVLIGETIDFEYSFKRKNGEINWYCYTIIPVFNEVKITGVIITTVDTTERKVAEQALIQSEFNYRQIVETAQEGIWLVDENNLTTIVNKKICDILEYSQKEMIGKENYHFMLEIEKQKAFLFFEKEVKSGKGGYIDLQFVTKSGKHIWTSISASPIFNDGIYKGSLGMVSDITERKNLQILLDKTNKLARVGNWEIDVLKGTVYWSSITKEIREAEPDFVPSLDYGMQMFKKDSHRKIITKRVKDAIDKGQSWDEELQILTQKGNLKWIRTIGEAEFLQGKCIKIFGSFQDIDARKKSEIEIRKAFDEKNIILESITDCFYALNKNWTFTYWNKGAENFLGKKREEVVGKNIWQEYPELVNSIIFQKYHLAVKEKIALHFEDFFETMNVWVEVNAYPSENGLSVYFKDITERKNAEASIVSYQSNIKAMLKNTDAIVYSLDINLNLVAFNEIFRNNIEMNFGFNIKPNDNISILFENFTPEESKFWIDIYTEALEGNVKQFEREFNFNNIPIFSSFSIHPIFENDNVIGLSCFSYDITKQKLSESELLNLNEQLRHLTSHLETVREYERTSIAREVHDELGQQMTRLKMDIGWLNTNIKDKNPEVIQRLLTMMEMVIEGISTIRRIVIQLRPGILDDLGLEAAIEWQAKEFEKNTGLPCFFTSSLNDELFSSEVNTAVFRIFQESMTNITRYAKATEINALLYEKDNFLVLEVMDNGIGILEERKNNKTSFGLMGMRERATILKGSFDIRKQPKGGTKVQLKIPI